MTAKNRDQLRNPTLGNGVRATFTLKKTLIGSRIQRTYIFKIRDFVLERKNVRNSHRLVICAQAAMHVLDSDV